MGLKGYRLWGMGQLDSTCSAPPHEVELAVVERLPQRVAHLEADVFQSSLGVALQVAFERQTLKPVFHLIEYRLWV
jgi:hypothetical protein